MIRGILFLSCLSLCLSVVNCSLHYNFWTVRDRDFIFSKHTPLMMTFQMSLRSLTLWPWPWPSHWKIVFLDFLVHLSRRLTCTIVITRCPSSVVHPSVCLSVRPSVVNFSHFGLLLWNEYKDTCKEARSQCPLPSLCFSGRSEKQDGCPTSDWLRHF